MIQVEFRIGGDITLRMASKLVQLLWHCPLRPKVLGGHTLFVRDIRALALAAYGHKAQELVLCGDSIGAVEALVDDLKVLGIAYSATVKDAKEQSIWTLNYRPGFGDSEVLSSFTGNQLALAADLIELKELINTMVSCRSPLAREHMAQWLRASRLMRIAVPDELPPLPPFNILEY
jgi:hypothetical protein